VTIIAGFQVKDGILLCSDTEWSGGSKVYQEKIFSHFFRGGAVSFALAGSEANGKMAIQDCRAALDLGRKRSYTVKEVRAIIRRAVRSIHEGYVDSRPADEKDAARFELMVAFALKSGARELLATSGPSVYPVDKFRCLGSGWYVGNHIIEAA